MMTAAVAQSEAGKTTPTVVEVKSQRDTTMTATEGHGVLVTTDRREEVIVVVTAEGVVDVGEVEDTVGVVVDTAVAGATSP